MIRVFRDYRALTEEAAQETVKIGQGAIEARRVFELVLSGGKTPIGVYRELARLTAQENPFWSKTHLFWGDERCVPPDDPQSNYLMAKRNLIDRLKTAPGEVHRIRTELPCLEEEIARYAAAFPRKLDLLMLGCGSDGHIASIFPDSPLLDETAKRFALVEAPVEPRRRVTITPLAIAAARSILVLVSGTQKVEAVRRVFVPEGSVRETPARLVRDATWFMDEDAIGKLAISDFSEVNITWQK